MAALSSSAIAGFVPRVHAPARVAKSSAKATSSNASGVGHTDTKAASHRRGGRAVAPLRASAATKDAPVAKDAAAGVVSERTSKPDKCQYVWLDYL